jgi:hypothetical protein
MNHQTQNIDKVKPRPTVLDTTQLSRILMTDFSIRKVANLNSTARWKAGDCGAENE